MFSYYRAQPKYRRASKVVAETYTLKTAVVGMDKNHNLYWESSMAPQSLIPCAEQYFASYINYGLFRTVGYRFLVIDSCKQTLKARWCLGAVLSHLMHHYVLTGAQACLR